MRARPHGRYDQGYTRTTMDGTKGSDTAIWDEPQQHGLSPDWPLQLDTLKFDSLVVVDQNSPVNPVPGLVHTARPTTRVVRTTRRWAHPQGMQAPTVWLVIGVKS